MRRVLGFRSVLSYPSLHVESATRCDRWCGCSVRREVRSKSQYRLLLSVELMTVRRVLGLLPAQLFARVGSRELCGCRANLISSSGIVFVICGKFGLFSFFSFTIYCSSYEMKHKDRGCIKPDG